MCLLPVSRCKISRVGRRSIWLEAGAVSVPLPLVRSAVFACPEVLEKVDIHTFCPRDFFIVHYTVTRDVIDFLVLSTPKHVEMVSDVKSLYKDMIKRTEHGTSARSRQTKMPLARARLTSSPNGSLYM